MTEQEKSGARREYFVLTGELVEQDLLNIPKHVCFSGVCLVNIIFMFLNPCCDVRYHFCNVQLVFAVGGSVCILYLYTHTVVV